MAIAAVALPAVAQAQSDPPGRVGRLAFTEGTVSFHDDQQTGWTPAVVNTPLTSGDAIWTEPNARSEVSLAGTRIRLEGGTQLDMLVVDDSQTRLQVDQGRIDIKTYTLDARTPYQIVTPRGTITLQQQGDYYVEAGSTQDATRLGVRSGAARIQSLNGQNAGGAAQARSARSTATPLAAAAHRQQRAAVAGALLGDARSAGQLRPAAAIPVGRTSPATRISIAMAAGATTASYGEVWMPRSVPSGWQPYRTGHWAYVQPWGWTWVDDQPWGFAPYHYGRWANSDNRWVWVPPQREVRPVYAPALVAFIGGVELAGLRAVGNRTARPVGWFPLGPREVYVPPYTTNRDYYQRINASDRVEDTGPARALASRATARSFRRPGRTRRDAWLEPALRHRGAGERLRALRSRCGGPRSRSQQQKVAAVPVAPVSAPPAPTASLKALATRL